jgi:hypothetical protein
MDHPYLADIHETRHVESFGKKGGGLHWLAKHRLTIPPTWVLTYTGAKKINAGPNGSTRKNATPSAPLPAWRTTRAPPSRDNSPPKPTFRDWRRFKPPFGLFWLPGVPPH